jgi:hypothetical protein
MFFNSADSFTGWYVLNDENEYGVIEVAQIGPVTFTLELEDVLIPGPAVLTVPDLQEVFFSPLGGLCSGEHAVSVLP